MCVARWAMQATCEQWFGHALVSPALLLADVMSDLGDATLGDLGDATRGLYTCCVTTCRRPTSCAGCEQKRLFPTQHSSTVPSKPSTNFNLSSPPCDADPARCPCAMSSNAKSRISFSTSSLVLLVLLGCLPLGEARGSTPRPVRSSSGATTLWETVVAPSGVALSFVGEAAEPDPSSLPPTSSCFRCTKQSCLP